MIRLSTFAVAVISFLTWSGAAGAQDIEVPILVFEASDADAPGLGDEAIDLANLVQSAAKQITTVQEAPAIVTVVTEGELGDRQFRTLLEVSDVVPGWMGADVLHTFPFVLVRGTQQAVLSLHNGTSLFSPQGNAPTLWRVVPMETIKRVEMVTGPGGVLWGANAFLGILNIITKDAEDVDGVEAAIGFGGGRGDPRAVRAYAMAGIPDLFGNDKIKLFTHVSVENFHGPRHKQPLNLLHSPPPQPNGPTTWAAPVRADLPRSMIINFDGKLTLGDVSLLWNIPFGAKSMPLSVAGVVSRKDLGEDLLPECTPVDPNTPPVREGGCSDRGRVARDNRWTWYDRYVIADYKTRFADDNAGFGLKAYAIQFKRVFGPLLVLPPVAGLLEGGLVVNDDRTTYRVGGAFDGDVQISDALQLLYGAEAFRSWIPSNVTLSRQGAGTEATFPGPYDLNRLPLPCPHTATFDANTMQLDPASIEFIEDCPLTSVFATDRTVMGGYAAARWRPTEKLALSGGARYQLAPASLGKRPYSLDRPLVEGALVYEFVDDWHVKINYAEGFRPPVFNNTDGNGESVNFVGERELKPETSKSIQAEINARLFRGVRNIRELNFRLDYSYTRLDNIITFERSIYENGSARALHSAEFLAKLYMRGNHRFELAYTWLFAQAEDLGTLRTTPEHWLAMSGVFNLLQSANHALDAHLTLRVFGAFEDPNRRVETGLLRYGDNGEAVIGPPMDGEPPQTVVVSATELVVDRIPASANLQVGVRFTTMDDRLILTATAYNALNATNYQPEPQHAYSPRVTFYPSPYPEFRFFTTATYRY